MTGSVLVAVAPNGARLRKTDHAGLPTTADDIGRVAAECHALGAAMIHLHVRDREGKHSLDPDHYRDAIKAVRAQAGPELLIQVTSEAAGVYSADEQIAAIRALRPAAVSVAVREVSGNRLSEGDAAAFYNWCRREAVAVQHILYDKADVELLRHYRANGIIADEVPRVLYVLGRYTNGQTSPPDLLPFLGSNLTEEAWMACAFGRHERNCLVAAALLGGNARVGFENNRELPSGKPAAGNAETVALLIAALASLGCSMATGDQARAIMGVVAS